MNAIAQSMRRIGDALGGFLRGFVGVAADTHSEDAGATSRSHRDCAHHERLTPALARAALAARAAGRSTCC